MSQVAVPLKTLETLRDISDPEEYRAVTNRMIGNAMPVVMQNWVLCAVYIKHKVFKEIVTNAGNVVKLELTTDQTKEDIWQGKMNLILAVGPRAFIDDPQRGYIWSDEERCYPGQWVTFPMHHCQQKEIATVPCRIVQDYHITERYLDPRHLTS